MPAVVPQQRRRPATTSNATRSADEIAQRLANTRSTTLQAMALTERALEEFRSNGTAATAENAARAYGGKEDAFADGGGAEDDGELGALVRQLETFAERRTGGAVSGFGGGANGTGTHRRSSSGERGMDKWGTKSSNGDADENSLVGYSMMYGSTVDDGTSVADLDDLPSEFESTDFSLPGAVGGRKEPVEKLSEIGSVTGRIDAVNDSLAMSKARLNESIASLEMEAGLGSERDFEQYKDEVPIVGNTKTGQPVIDMVAAASNTLSASSSRVFTGQEREAELSPTVKMFNSVFGCCALRK